MYAFSYNHIYEHDTATWHLHEGFDLVITAGVSEWRSYMTPDDGRSPGSGVLVSVSSFMICFHKIRGFRFWSSLSGLALE